MPISEIGKAKCLIKIEELEEKKKELVEKLSKKQGSNTLAWNTYGSELCAGAMVAEEDEIREEIEEVRQTIAWLKAYFDGTFDASIKRQKEIESNIDFIELEIERLEGSKKRHKLVVEKIKKIRGLLK